MWSFEEDIVMVVVVGLFQLLMSGIPLSDDKTLVVTNITREIREETDFLNLFQPFGEVTCAKLASINQKGTLHFMVNVALLPLSTRKMLRRLSINSITLPRTALINAFLELIGLPP
ncbi:hypothetical protein TSUD_102030 [Trifolium subterraneum]|uniref:RRM domain-containing protein n=1 Tax=Trifolium subterraneum TaxID=3900 RepID=A0A2Z6N4I5_TRISU|nr:hypothetical protein TSUD_102030 [Trifolium subterraneum]